MRIFALATALLAFTVASPAQADDHDSDFAENSFNIGLSPFGGSLNFGHNFSERTSLQVGLGGLPETALLTTEIDGVEYDITGRSSWAGVFLNHRALESADWLRFNVGFASGGIWNTLEDADGNTYRVEYRENPVVYTGLGVGFRPKKGLVYGFDIGALFGAGADVYADAGNTTDAAEAVADSSLFGPVLPNFQFGIGWGF